MVKILLAESEVVIREGIKKLFTQTADYKIVALAASDNEIIDLLKKTFIPDMVLAGWTNADANALNWVKILKAKYPATPVILLTMLSEAENIKLAFQIGVSGYLLRNVRKEELFYALRHVMQGGIHLSSELTHQLIKAILSGKGSKNNLSGDCIFTEQELLLMQALADGHTNKQIGERIFLSSRSVEAHRAFLLKKAGVNNTAALIKFGMGAGLIC